MIIADAIIAAAYFFIPAAVRSCVRQRPQNSHQGLAWLFSGFIFACGLTHGTDIWTIWRTDDTVHAATKAVSFHPNPFLMGIQMLGQDGLEVTRVLKADPATRHVRVMAFTAFAMRGDEAKMGHAGCDGYLSKPIDVRTFGAQVQACLAASDGAPWCSPVTDTPRSAVKAPAAPPQTARWPRAMSRRRRETDASPTWPGLGDGLHVRENAMAPVLGQAQHGAPFPAARNPRWTFTRPTAHSAGPN